GSELTDTRKATIIGNRGDFSETELAQNRPQRLGVLQNPDYCVHPDAIDHGLRSPGVPGEAILNGTDPAPAGPGVGRSILLPAAATAAWRSYRPPISAQTQAKL